MLQMVPVSVLGPRHPSAVDEIEKLAVHILYLMSLGVLLIVAKLLQSTLR